MVRLDTCGLLARMVQIVRRARRPSHAARDISLFADLNSLFFQSDSLSGHLKFPVISEQGIAI